MSQDFRNATGGSVAAVALNTTHRTSDGTDHANVVLNDTHRASDGTDHSNVVLNDTHRASDGSDHTFIDQDVTSGASPTLDGTNITDASSALTIVQSVRKGSAGTIAKGNPVYVSGFHVGSSSTEVEEADNDAAGTMPAFGLAMASITNSANTDVILEGKLLDVNTSSWSAGDELYVSGDPSTTLGLINSKPTGTKLIQRIAIVLRSHASNGVLAVYPGRANDLPQISDTNLWVGDATGVPTGVAMSGDATMANTGAVTIADEAVTLAKMAHMATASLLGRNTASTGDVEVLSKATALSLLNVEDGADVTDETNVTAALPVVDETALVYKTGDATANVKIDAAAITTATSRTMTMPDANVTLGNIAVNTTHLSSDGSDHTFIDQSVISGAAPTFTADNLSDGGSNAIITTTQETNFTSAFTHVSNNGSDHSFIDQDVTSGSSPTFTGTNITGVPGTTGVYRTLWIDAAAMVSRTTNGAEVTTVEHATNDIMIDSFAFDASTEEGVQFKINMPDEWDLGTIKYKIYWDAKATASGTGVWGVKAGALSNDDAIDAALGTEISVTDTLLAVGDVHVAPASTALTVGGTPALEDMTVFQVVCKISGTIAVDTLLMGIAIQYKESTTEPVIW